MTTPYFLDTNVLVYGTSLAADHAPKRDAARAWLARPDWGVSTQVPMELYAQARQPRHGLLPTAAQALVEGIAARRPVVAVDKEIVLEALAQRQSLPLALGRGDPARRTPHGRAHRGRRRSGAGAGLRRRDRAEPVPVDAMSLFDRLMNHLHAAVPAALTP